MYDDLLGGQDGLYEHLIFDLDRDCKEAVPRSMISAFKAAAMAYFD